MWVRSDPQLLQRVLANLVENALKYTVQGDVLMVARARGDEVWIDVRDTGLGIAREHLERIFEEFYQVDNPGRDRSGGLGIGLSIVQRLSHLLEHPVRVRSRPGRGSLFRVVLPVAAGVAVANWQSESFGRFRRGRQRLPTRVLVLDDETQIQDAMLALLRAYAVEVSRLATRPRPKPYWPRRPTKVARTRRCCAISAWRAVLMDWTPAGACKAVTAPDCRCCCSQVKPRPSGCRKCATRR